MQIVAKNPTTGKKFTGKAEALTKADVRELNDFRIPALGGTERDVDRFIDNLDIPGGVPAKKWAEARMKLKEMSGKVVEVVIDGVKTVIRVGLKLLECALHVCQKHPKAVISVIFALIVGDLVSAIPVIQFLFEEFLIFLVPIIIGAIIKYRKGLPDKLKQAIQHEKLTFENLNTA